MATYNVAIGGTIPGLDAAAEAQHESDLRELAFKVAEHFPNVQGVTFS